MFVVVIVVFVCMSGKASLAAAAITVGRATNAAGTEAAAVAERVHLISAQWWTCKLFDGPKRIRSR